MRLSESFGGRSKSLIFFILIGATGCSMMCKVNQKATKVLKQQNVVIESILKERKVTINDEVKKSENLLRSEQVLRVGLMGIVDSNEKLMGGLR